MGPCPNVCSCIPQITAVVARNRAPFPAAGFEMPSRDLGFFGVPDKSTVFLIPCTGCLVSLTTLPVRCVGVGAGVQGGVQPSNPSPRSRLSCPSTPWSTFTLSGFC